MKIYKDGELYVEITSPDELLGMYQTIANNLRNNYFSNVEVMRLIASARSIYQVATMPSEPTINTVYYVGTEAPYDVKLVASNGTIVPLGDSDADFSNFYTKTECDYRFLDKQNFLNHIFPKGSIFTTYENKNPSTFLGGTWVLIGGQDANLNYYPAFAIATDTEGTTIDESLPAITASFRPGGNWPVTPLRTDVTVKPTVVSGAFSLENEELSLFYASTTDPSSILKPKVLNFDASKGQVEADGTTYKSQENSTYKNGAHVNVNAIKIFFWRRTDDAPIVFNTGNITMDTKLDENATDDHIPTSKAVVDYVSEHGGSQIVETVLWQSPNGINGTSFYSRPTDITLTDNIKDYHLFKFTISRDDSKINSYYLTLKDIQLYAGSSYRFMPSLSYDSELSYLEVDIPATADTNIFHINNSNKCNLVNITGYKSIPMLNTYSREIRELIMNTRTGGVGPADATITLTKGMSNFDYLEFYFNDSASNSNNYLIQKIAVSDLINLFNSSSSRFAVFGTSGSSDKRYALTIYRTSDTTLSINYNNMALHHINGIKAEPVVQNNKNIKFTTLWEGTLSSAGSVTLSQSINDFPIIIVKTDNTVTTNNYGQQNNIYMPSLISFNTNIGVTTADGNTNSYYMTFAFTNSTTLNLVYTSRSRILAVYGVSFI